MNTRGKRYHPVKPARSYKEQLARLTLSLIHIYMTYRLAKLSRETGLRAGFMHVPTQTAYACRHRERMLAAAADEEAKEKLLAAPIAGMELEMMVRGTRAALEACLPSLPL